MIQESIGVGPLHESQVVEASALIARAFDDDPVFAYIYPDPTERRRWLSAQFAPFVRYLCRYSEPPLVTAPLAGVALWIPPDGLDPTDDQRAAVGWDRGALRAAGALNRYLNVFAYLGAQLNQAITVPCWYLDLIAVEPVRQGTGVGSLLMEAMLARTDADGMATALLSARPRNVAFYERHGYEIVCQGVEPLSGVSFQGFFRSPRQ